MFQFAAMVAGVSELNEALGTAEVQFTVFVPRNAAMEEVPQQVLNTINAMTQRSRALKKEVVLYHLSKYFSLLFHEIEDP